MSFKLKDGLRVGSQEVIDSNGKILTAFANPVAISLSGDVVGSANFDGSTGISISTTIQPNSITLGTDTTGAYVADIVAGGAITLSETANNAEGNVVTISHSDTSSQSSVNNSGNTFIQDVTLDAYGHITGLTSATVVVGDGSFTVTAGSGLTGGGVLGTANQTGATSVTISHADTSSQASVDNSNGVVIQDVTLDGYGHVTGLASVDLDGRYSQLGHSHDYIYGGSGWQNVDLNTIANEAQPGQLRYEQFALSSTNAPPMVDNANGVITVGQHSSNYSAQLSFSSDGNVYWRDNPGGAHGTWRKVWDSGNDGSGSGLDADLLDGHDSSYFSVAHSHPYVDEAGDTMTGRLTFSGLTVQAPSTTDAVSGARIVLYPTGGGMDYAIGIESNTMWFNSDNYYRWYVDGSEQAFMGTDYFKHNSDIRTPIFYDSDNTAYYGDFASTSNLNLLRASAIATGTAGYSGGAYDLDLGGSVHTHNYDINYVNQLHFNDNLRFYDNGDDRYLIYKWGNSGSGGIQFYDGDGTRMGYIYGDGGTSFGLLDANGSWALRVDPSQVESYKNTYVPNLYAYIMYDRNDTGYYVDPNSVSVLGGLQTWPNGHSYRYIESFNNLMTNWQGTVNSQTTWGWAIRYAGTQTRAMIAYDHASTEEMQFASGYGPMVFNINPNNGNLASPNDGTEVMRLWTSTGINTNISVRAPIFYDSNDTNYYLDANSTSTSLKIAGTIEQGENYAHPNVEWAVSGNTTGEVIFYLPGTTGNYGMVHMVFDIYEYNSPRHCTVEVSGHNWSTAWYNYGSNVVGYTDKEVRLGVKDGRFVVVFGNTGSSWTYGTIRLRKIHNGGFYPNSMDLGGNWSTTLTTTESFSWISGDLRELRTSSTMYSYAYRGHSNVAGTGEASYHPVGVYSTGTNWLYGTIITNNNSVDAGTGTVTSGRTYGTTDIRSPIFYDYNDTGYYINPNAESKVKKIWINNGGVGGVSWSSGLNMGDGSSYWNMIQDTGIARQRNFGTGGFDWFSSSASQLMTLSNAGSLSASTDIRAPVFYDSNNTGYYTDPASTSRLNVIDANGQLKANYFQAKVLGGSGIGDSYDERVVLLCPKVTTNTSWHNIVDGTITALKTGGNVCDTFDVFCHSVYNDTRATFTSRGQRDGHKLVECTYGGITWIAIKFSYTANPYNYFLFNGQASTNVTGHGNNQLLVISYYDTNGGGVLNSEIYNSIVDYAGYGTNWKSTASNYYFGNEVGSTYWSTINSDYLSHSSDVRAPLFYDSNNTAYYLDGSSTGTSLNVAGSIIAAGNITAYSDIRVKSDIEDINQAVSKVSMIRGVTYTRTDLADNERRHAGVIAQEVEQVLPEAVIDDTLKRVDYNALVGLLIEAIKEQQKQIDELKALINK